MSNVETFEHQTKPNIERKNSNSELLDLESPSSGPLTELEKLITENFQKPTIIENFFGKLDEYGLETLEHWKKLTKEEKKKYPDGLKHLLDEKAGIEPENVSFAKKFKKNRKRYQKEKRKEKEKKKKKKKKKKKRKKFSNGITILIKTIGRKIKIKLIMQTSY